MTRGSQKGRAGEAGRAEETKRAGETPPSAPEWAPRAALAPFTPAVRDWFARAFAEPTPAQTRAWPAIASGGHCLIAAPTGSGKTLAAFLWALDRLVAEPPPKGARRGPQLVYVSPLKALGYDVERNLRAPLRGIGANVRVATRTGDTPPNERRAMLRTPPDILITTPESLYLMLTSQARELFAATRWLILDEIHAVAHTKRGSHLAVTLERLVEAAGRDVQRIGLSATQKPLEEVARYLVGPQRRCAIVDAGVRKPLDVRIQVPVESMTEPETPVVDLRSIAGGEGTRRSIWPAIYPEVLELVRNHHTTLVFVNNRRAAERIALRLNELAAGGRASDAGAPWPPAAAPVIARAHHGSLAREERLEIEEELKAGRLPCLVATSSLELGIDMGAVDLVVQIESPKSVSRGLQRVGRAGHGVGAVSRGRIFPKFRADLLECAVVARRMREGLIETTVVPRNPLDVLAQQVVAIAASAGEEGVRVAALHDSLRRTWTYAELERRQLDNVLDMLAGRYPSQAFRELRARIVWDREEDTIRALPGARGLAVANAGTIPDRGLFSVNLPDGRRVGELDEEMVYEARVGQTFLLGASAWRIEEITRDRVVVAPAPGAAAAVPFWHGESVGRPRELGDAIGAFARWAVEQEEATLEREYDLDERAASNLLAYLREQRAATGAVPSDRVVVVERFRDEIGDWRLCVLTPFGGRVHAAWALALSAHIRARLGLEAEAIWSDDGIAVHLPDADAPPSADLVLPEADQAEELVVGELGGSALFGARFRENASRALLIPRARPGRRTPLWQQRLKAQSLLEVARDFPDFPIVLETYRECLRDVLDVPGLVDILRRLERRDLALVEAETVAASPFASSLLFDYVATYMYEGDTPSAERRAAALALDRDLLRELLGQEALRDLIDARALGELETELQGVAAAVRARDEHGLHALLRRLGDLSEAEVRERAAVPEKASAWLRALEAERRAARVWVAGDERWIAAEDAGLYRDALGIAPPDGLPAPFTEPVDDALLELLRRFAGTHGPFLTDDVRRRYGLDAGAALTLLERDGELVRGELRPLGTEREWCDPEVLRRLRRASLAALRREIEPVGQEVLARFAPAWQGVDAPVPYGAGAARLRETLVTLQGVMLPVEVWEGEVLPRRLGAYSPAWLDELCAGGQVVWVGSRRADGSEPRAERVHAGGAIGSRPVRAQGARVAFYLREDAALLGPPAKVGEAPRGALHDLVRRRLERGACFFADLLLEFPSVAADDMRDAVWDLVWAGEATNDAFAPLRERAAGAGRARRAPAPSERRGSRRFSRGRGAAPLQGRWSLTAPLFAPEPSADARRRAWAELLLERHGIVTRELVRAEGVEGGFAALYPSLAALDTLGQARRGYFVEGLGAAQFALPGAVERLRAETARGDRAVVLGTADPAQPFGAALRWPSFGGRAPARRAGSHTVLVGGRPILVVESRGRRLVTNLEASEAELDTALTALASAVRAGRISRLTVEKVDDEEALESPFRERLLACGFRPGLRRLTLESSPR